MPASLRIAVATHCFHLPIRDAVRTAAACGVRGVQINARDELAPTALSDTGRRQFLHYLRENAIEVASLVFPTRRTYMDSSELDARVAATKTAMQFAAHLKASVLTVRVGRIPGDKESKDYALLRDVLNDLARYGNHVGVTLAVTPTLDSPESLNELLAAVTTGHIGIDFDPASFVTAGHKPTQCLRTLYQSVVHVQARDAVRGIEGGGAEVALGRGEVDWTELLPLLSEIEYRGWLTVNRTQGEDRAGDATRAIKFLQQFILES